MENLKIKLKYKIGEPDNNLLISKEIWNKSLDKLKELIERNSLLVTLGKEEPLFTDFFKAIGRIKEINDEYAIIELIKDVNSTKNTIDIIGIDNLRLNFNAWCKYDKIDNLKVVTRLTLGTFYIDYCSTPSHTKNKRGAV